MTVSKDQRKENHHNAFTLMLGRLGDQAIDTTLFNPSTVPFREMILRTTWEELTNQGYVESVPPVQYRLTAKGWLTALELAGQSREQAFQARLGRLFAAMKRHVDTRKEIAIVPLEQLAIEVGEPHGWIFNVIESKAASTLNKRTGSSWHGGEKGRLIEIPVDFNLEPIDIASSLTVEHLQRIQDLEERLQAAEEDRAQFHCPHCDAEISGIGGEDFPEAHCYVTYESFACGYVTADGRETVPCPYGPNYPSLEEFDFLVKQQEGIFVCYTLAKSARARAVTTRTTIGNTEEEAIQRARSAVEPKKKAVRG